MKKLLILFVFTIIPCFTLQAGAETYKVAIMQLSNTEMYEELFAALGEATNNVFEIKVVPFARATNMIENKLVDIQVPRIKGKNEQYNNSLKFDFANAKTGNTVAYVLYTNKNKPIDISDLRKGNTKSYKIETTGANMKDFGFISIFSRKADYSLQEIASGRIDGAIFSQNTGDAALKSLKLKNIRRQLWDNFDVSFTLQKGQAGGKLDKILAEGINKLRASGKLEQIISEANRKGKYNNWQP